MKYLAELIETLSQNKNEELSISHLSRYFNSDLPLNDKNEALRLLLNSTPKRLITTKELKAYVLEITCLPEWIVERSVDETNSPLKGLSLLLHGEINTSKMSISEWVLRISSCQHDNEGIIKQLIKEIAHLNPAERLFIIKLITGTFKPPTSRKLLITALSKAMNISFASTSLRLFEKQLKFRDIKNPVLNEQQKIPSPFPLVEVLDYRNLDSLGNPAKWIAYGKKDGIHAQIVSIENSVYLWSEDGEILNNSFPEIIRAMHSLGKDMEVNGQIIPYDSETSLERLYIRMGKKSIPKKEIESYQATFEIWKIEDATLGIGQSIEKTSLQSIKKVSFSSWQDLAETHKSCRDHGLTGILLQNKNKPNHYLFWKASYYTINAYLIYVELGSMLNQGLKSMTFGVYNDNNEIIPIAKVEEFENELDLNEILEYAKHNTTERFGPVRTIKPALVYALNFDGVSESKRRKSGLIIKNVQVKKKISKLASAISKLEDIQKLLS